MAKSKSEQGQELLKKRTAAGLELVEMVRTETGDTLKIRQQIKKIDEQIIALVQSTDGN